MRSFLAFTALFLLLVARPVLAVDTFVPGDGCDVLGSTHMSADRTGLVVCSLEMGSTSSDATCGTSGGCTWKLMINPRYDLSCFHAYDGNDYQNCCKIDTETGDVICRAQQGGSGNPWYDYVQKPWNAGAPGHYRLSCWARPNQSWQFCCRANADTGATECKTVNGSGNLWYLTMPPF